MRLETILNQVEKHKSFVYCQSYLEQAGQISLVVIPVESRKNSRAECSGCGRRGPTYDHLAERRSSTSRCGACWCFWRIGCVGWIVHRAG